MGTLSSELVPHAQRIASLNSTSKISRHFGHFTVAAYGGVGGTSRCSRVTKRGPTFIEQNGHATA